MRRTSSAYRRYMSSWRTPPVTLDPRGRAELAEQAWQHLPNGGSEQAKVRILCGANHHVATVYTTDIGLVYRSQIRRHGHGDRDLPDSPRGGTAPKPWFDLLESSEVNLEQASDQLPAWCECGSRMLSRAAVLRWAAEGEHRVILD